MSIRLLQGPRETTIETENDLLLDALRSIVVDECICGDMEFSFYRREARAVFLCGDFNSWWLTLPMTRMDDGWWRCRLHLAPGSYQFKYLADSGWYVDYAAFGITRGPLGEWNSVVLVREELGDAEPRRASATDIAMPMQLSEARMA